MVLVSEPHSRSLAPSSTCYNTKSGVYEKVVQCLPDDMTLDNKANT